MSTEDQRPWDRRGRPYECRTCGERFELEHYVCPACGGFSVERG